MNSVAILLGLLTIIGFVIHAWLIDKPKRSSSDFFFADSSLTPDLIAANLSATASSLSTALLFLLFQTPVYGAWIFGIIIMFLVGQYIFVQVVTKNLGRVSSDEFGSIYRVVLFGTQSKKLARTVNLLNVFTFAILLLIEIILGASILSFVAPSFAQTTFLGVAIVTIGVALYVVIGGFSVVTYSDRWQFWFLFVAVLVTLVFFGTYYSITPAIHISDALSVLVSIPEGSKWVLYTFIANVIVVNTALPICQSSSWQRFSASESTESFNKGYRDAFWKQLVWAWLAFVFLSVLFYNANGSQPNGFADLFQFIDGSGALGHWFVFPVLFAGLVAAIVSTADSLLVCLILGFEDFFTTRKTERGFEIDKSINKKRYARWAAVSVFIILLAFLLFDAATDNTRALLLGLMFTAVGQTTLILPFVLVSIFFGVKQGFSIENNKAIFAIALGFIILWIFALSGIIKNDVGLNQIGPIVALALTSLVTWWAVKRLRPDK